MRIRNWTIWHHVTNACVIFVLLGINGALARGIDDIRLSKTGSLTTVDIELGCAMRYLSHAAMHGGTEVHIQMSTGQDCRLALRGVWNELRRPIGGRMAKLFEVEFDRRDGDQATITLHFEETVGVDIKQTSNRYMLTVLIDTGTVMPPPQPAAAPVSAETTERRSEPPVPIDSDPGRLVRRPPDAARNRFVIRVAVLSDAESIDGRVLEQFASKVVYTNEIVVGTRRWAELRIGFFDSESEAQRALNMLGADFQSAWITVANPEEQTRARERLYEWTVAESPAVSTTSAATNITTRREATLATDAITAMLIEAEGALLRQDFATSIRIYTRLLEEPAGDFRPKARELLGVARQKNGQIAEARAEYEAYLIEFPDGPDAKRVQQRLAAIAVPINQRSFTPATARAAEKPQGWEFFGSASQYYLRGVSLGEDAEPDFVVQSALLSQGHLHARHRGGRVEMLARANVGYLHDFVEDGSGDQGLVSHAYIDLNDTRTELSARVGRQLQQSGGALGRFDGVHASYRLQPDLAINLTAGFPVDSPRFLATTDHYFYGASLDFDNFAEAWDFGIFANLQTIDGISDRQAVGAEAQFTKDGVNVIGLLDYDASYNVINTALIAANWRINDRLTLYGRYRGGAAPFLTTRNAIIGQPVNTVRELFPVYSEGQIRRLARNRTAEEQAGSAGLTTALTARLQFKADITYAEYSDTVASGGVDALLPTGPQYSWGGHLIGSGFVTAGQVFIVGYRHYETQSVDTDSIWFDLRQPIGDNLRIQSRLSVAKRAANQNPAGNIEQWIANPVLRLSYTWRRRYQFELEFGGQWSNREFPDALTPPLTPEGEVQSSDYYLQLGYVLDF